MDKSSGPHSNQVTKINQKVGHCVPLDVKLEEEYNIIPGEMFNLNLIIKTQLDKSKLRGMLQKSWPEIMKSIIKDKNPTLGNCSRVKRHDNSLQRT